MRYLPNNPQGNVTRLNNGARPPLEILPKSLADKLLERDQMMTRRSTAQSRVSELAALSNDHDAKADDDTAASTAARAGKPIPAPKALPKLQQDRTEAERALEAMEAAYSAVTDECETLAASLYWDNLDKLLADRAKARERLRKQADELADAVEAAVAAEAVAEWMRGVSYERRVATYAVDVIPDIARRGLGRHDIAPVEIRALLTTAATTVLDTQEN